MFKSQYLARPNWHESQFWQVKEMIHTHQFLFLFYFILFYVIYLLLFYLFPIYEPKCLQFLHCPETPDSLHPGQGGHHTNLFTCILIDCSMIHSLQHSSFLLKNFSFTSCLPSSLCL
jgi:hypothetical protein